MLKLTTDKHEASRGLSATAELLVSKVGDEDIRPGGCSGVVVEYRTRN